MAVNKKVNIELQTKGTDKAKRAFGGVESSIKTMVVAGLSIAGLKKAIDLTIGAAVKQENIFRSLRTQVELSGKSWDKNETSLKSMFDQLQATTQYGDTESAQVLQKLMTFTNDYDKSTENLALTLDMASTGLFDANTAARMMGMAMTGNVEILGRYIPELKTTNNEQLKTMTSAEKAEYALKLLNEKFSGAAQKNLKSTAGQYKQMTNYLGDIGEAIGDKALPMINSLLQSTTGFFNKLSETTLETAVRQLREMGVAAEELQALQVGVNIENQMQRMISAQSEVDKMFNNISASFRSVDIAKEITGLSTLREIQKSNLDINLLNREAIKENLENIKAEAKAIMDGGVENVKAKSGVLTLLGEEQAALTKLLSLIMTYDNAYSSLNSNQTQTTQSKTKEVELTTDLVQQTIAHNDAITLTSKTMFWMNDRLKNLDNTTAEAALRQKQLGGAYDTTALSAQSAANAIRSLGALLDNENAKLSDYLMGIGGVLGMIPGFQGFSGALSIGGAIGSVLGFAEGGDPPTGRPSIVGERGPELFVPKVAGTIIPNNQMGGVTINISGDFLGTEQQADKLAYIIAERSKGNFNNIAVKA